MKVAPTVLFRCDAAVDIGFGHLSRCLNVADTLGARGARCRFVLRQQSEPLSHRIVERGHQLSIVSCSRTGHATLSEQDVRATLQLTTTLAATWLIVDSYGASSAQLSTLAQCQARLAVIDDTSERDFSAADMLIVPTIGAEHWSHRTGKTTRCYLGTTYALLHAAFATHRAASLARRSGPADEDPRVFICLGGTDALGLVERAIALTQHTAPGAQIVAIVPRAIEPDTATPSVNRLPPQTPAKIAQQLAAADIAIATPSTIAWEIACLGLPCCLLPVAANQSPVAAGLAKFAAVRIMDRIDAVPDHLGALLQMDGTVRRAALTAWADLVDGRGCERISEALLAAPAS